MRYVFKVDDIAIPTPTEYQADIEDLSSEQTGRTLDGEMHKDVVAVKDTYTCTWKRLNWTDTARLLNAVNGKTEVNFTYADPRVPNTMLTNKFYIGKRSTPVGVITENDGIWKDIKLTFIRI